MQQELIIGHGFTAIIINGRFVLITLQVDSKIKQRVPLHALARGTLFARWFPPLKKLDRSEVRHIKPKRE